MFKYHYSGGMLSREEYIRFLTPLLGIAHNSNARSTTNSKHNFVLAVFSATRRSNRFLRCVMATPLNCREATDIVAHVLTDVTAPPLPLLHAMFAHIPDIASPTKGQSKCS